MALVLYPHQIQASQAVSQTLVKGGDAMVIFAAGMGKSYVAFHLIDQYPEAVFLWLTPIVYSFHAPAESLSRTNYELSLDNVTFYIYASLIYKTLEKLVTLLCGYIILNEFHRYGSEYWGAMVRELLDGHPQAKLLYLFTPICYLDHQRNMIEDLLDNCIAAKLTLGKQSSGAFYQYRNMS